MIGFCVLVYPEVDFIVTLSDRLEFGIDQCGSVPTRSDAKRQEPTVYFRNPIKLGVT
jgi:hypothetical protein